MTKDEVIRKLKNKIIELQLEPDTLIESTTDNTDILSLVDKYNLMVHMMNKAVDTQLEYIPYEPTIQEIEDIISRNNTLSN